MNVEFLEQMRKFTSVRAVLLILIENDHAEDHPTRSPSSLKM